WFLVSAEEKACFGRANLEVLDLSFSTDGRALLGGSFYDGGLGDFAPLGGEDCGGWAWKDVSRDRDASQPLAVFAGTYTGAAVQEDGGVIPVSITIDKTGKVRLAGKYSDGMSVSASGTLGGYWQDDEGTEYAELDLILLPRTLGCGACRLNILAYVDETRVPTLILDGYTTTYTEKTVKGAADIDLLNCLHAEPFTPGCWIPEDADPDFGVVRLVCEEDVIDILYTSRNGQITGLGKATATGYGVKFDAKTGFLTVTKGRAYTIQGVLGDCEKGCTWAGGFTADGRRFPVVIDYTTLPAPDERFPWTEEGFVLTVGESCPEDMQPSVWTDDGPLELSISGLPTGLKFDKKTGLITGAPKRAGSFTVKIGYTYATRKITRTTTLVVTNR
ncbi:MAG: Ig domain-containing protein, partial [Kiritimatiellia bacterium]